MDGNPQARAIDSRRPAAVRSQGVHGELIRGVLSEPRTELGPGERMATATAEPLTAEDLLRLSSEGVKGELIRGVLCETVQQERDTRVSREE